MSSRGDGGAAGCGVCWALPRIALAASSAARAAAGPARVVLASLLSGLVRAIAESSLGQIPLAADSPVGSSPVWSWCCCCRARSVRFPSHPLGRSHWPPIPRSCRGLRRFWVAAVGSGLRRFWVVPVGSGRCGIWVGRLVVLGGSGSVANSWGLVLGVRAGVGVRTVGGGCVIVGWGGCSGDVGAGPWWMRCGGVQCVVAVGGFCGFASRRGGSGCGMPSMAGTRLSMLVGAALGDGVDVVGLADGEVGAAVEGIRPSGL